MHSRLRSWLAIINIVIGIVAVVAIVSIGEGMQQNVESRLGGFGADIITITSGAERASKVVTRWALGGLRSTTTSTNAENLTKKDIQVLRSIDSVTLIQGTVSGTGEVYYLGETATVTIEGG